jgi:ketosteroid isomerase-like protein
MSEHESRQLVEQAYASFKAGDIQTLLQSMSEDIAWQCQRLRTCLLPATDAKSQQPTSLAH